MRKDKLQRLSSNIQEFVDQFKHNEQKPVYYWCWLRRLMGINLEIIRIKYNGK